MVPGKDELKHLYRKRAGSYDLTANLYYLIGFREQAYRQEAVVSLGLEPGDTVVEIGCGTGLNFPLLQRAVGPTGRIIGVDLTEAMLEIAQERVKRQGWTNVELVHGDAAEFHFPEKVGGILSVFALTLVPEFDQVIRNGCLALTPGKRCVVLDFKLPSTPAAALFVPLLVFLTKPFGVRRELAERHPWEAIEKYLGNVTIIELYFGFAYIAVGEKGVVCQTYSPLHVYGTKECFEQ